MQPPLKFEMRRAQLVCAGICGLKFNASEYLALFEPRKLNLMKITIENTSRSVQNFCDVLALSVPESTVVRQRAKSRLDRVAAPKNVYRMSKQVKSIPRPELPPWDDNRSLIARHPELHHYTTRMGDVPLDVDKREAGVAD